jgi:hypoxanthine phosphoribosyltransferase
MKDRNASARMLPDYGELAEGVGEILISEERLRQRVAEIAHQVSSDYAGLNPLLVGVLKGVLFFMSDLLQSLTIQLFSRDAPARHGAICERSGGADRGASYPFC